MSARAAAPVPEQGGPEWISSSEWLSSRPFSFSLYLCSEGGRSPRLQVDSNFTSVLTVFRIKARALVCRVVSS